METRTFFLSVLLWIICVNGLPTKHALKDECKYNNLQSGTYRCILPDEEITFFVDCMTDGTMYINPGQQALYHFHKQTGDEMEFKLILSAQYIDEDDVNQEEIDLILNNNNDYDINDEKDEEEDEPLNDEVVDELSSSTFNAKNVTAQYIVYTIIIVMALIFSCGICLLIYWWCCHKRLINNSRMNQNVISNDINGKSGKFGDLIDLNEQENGNIINNNDEDETQPFIDIRGKKTMQRQHLQSMGRTLYFGRINKYKKENNIDINDDIDNINDYNNDKIDILQRERRNIYDDINGIDDNEDGDDLIAHYGATSNREYVINQ